MRCYTVCLHVCPSVCLCDDRDGGGSGGDDNNNADNYSVVVVVSAAETDPGILINSANRPYRRGIDYISLIIVWIIIT